MTDLYPAEEYPAERYEQKAPSFYRTGDALESYGQPASLDQTKEAANLVFGSIFEGLGGEISLPQLILDTLIGNVTGLIPGLDDWLEGLPEIVGEALENLQAIVNQIGDLFQGLVVTPINSVVAGVKDWFDNLLPDQLGQATNNAVSNVASDFGSVAANLLEVAATILGLQNTAVENSTAIAAINAANGGNGGSGVYFVDTFDRANSSSLGSDWIVVDPSGVGVQVYGNEALAGTAANGAIYAKCMTPAVGDNMSVAMVAGTIGSGLLYDSALHIRMNLAQTAWVYLNVFKNKVYLGRASRSGASVTYTDWVSVTSGISISKGTQLELRAEGSTYRAYVGGTLVASYTDAAVSHPVGSTTRSTGFKARYDVFGSSLALSSFAMADITVPDTVGTGWSLYRNSSGSSSATTWSTTGVAFGSDTFDVKDREANVTVDVLGVGRIKIIKAGWYSVSVSARGASAKALVMVGLLGGAVAGSLSLIRVGSVGQDTDEDSGGTPSSTTSPRNWSGTWTVYCPAGYYLAPAGVTQSGTNSVALVGVAGGYATNFHGALMNPG